MWRRYRLQEQNREGGRSQAKSFRASGGSGNDERLAAIERIGEEADGQRTDQLQDVDGERVVGKFQNGEMDDAPAAVARRARAAEDEAAEAAREQADRDAEAERLEQEEAERLQAEGADPDRETGERREQRQERTEDDDEKVVAGVRYYKTIVAGQERWLTMKQLRTAAGASANAEETLQRAQDALASASHAQLTPKAAPAEELSDQDLENVILSAGMGDEEAVRKLASVVKGSSKGASAQEIRTLVAQQIATTREVDRAETAQAELLGNEILEPIFRQRLTAFAERNPKSRIVDAYKAVGEGLRKDFAAMLKPGTKPVETKLERKRQIVAPPASAGRQPARQDDDREVPVSEQIDAIAKGRGQLRAHRVRRS
jgi:hypothetical protein